MALSLRCFLLRNNATIPVKVASISSSWPLWKHPMSTNRVSCTASKEVSTFSRIVASQPTCRSSFLLQPSVVSWSVYRTKKGNSKDKGKKSHKKVTLTEEQLEGLLNTDRLKQDYEHILEDLKDKFIHQLSVRTSQGVFDNLSVKTPDGAFPLIQLGQVLQKSPQLLTINMTSNPQYIPNVKEALTESGLNVNPQQDGTSLFIPLPKVTREHRENLAKSAKMLSEKSKKSLRDIYSKYSKKIKSSKEGHSVDDRIAADDLAQNMMHEMIQQVDNMTTAKQQELMGGK